jgi:hypothetical protein
MTSKEIVERVQKIYVPSNRIKENYFVMFGALLEIGLDWEGKINYFPEAARPAISLYKDLEWLSGILKQVTGITWEELTDGN